MSGLTEVPLGDVLRVKHGYAFPGAGFGEDTGSPQVLTPGNFSIGGGFKKSKPKSFAGDYPAEYALSAGDLIVSMTDLSKSGDTLGLPARVPEGDMYLHNQRIGLVEVIAPELVTTSFLNYFLRTDSYRSYVLGTASGSTVRHTSPSRIHSYVASLPSLGTQQAIAEVLGALDDKIAANTKLAKAADELAEATFLSAAKTAEYTGATFADIGRISGGGTPSTRVPDYWGGDVYWATPTDITALVGPYLESTSRTITEKGLAACSSQLFPPGAILMTSRATIGAFAVNQVPAAVNQGFIVVEPHDKGLKNWILHDMRSRVDEFVSMANGATFLELSRGNFKKLRARMADEETMRSFGAYAESLHAAGRHVLRENSSIAELRDTLLPELMSGRLRVKDAEKKIEEVA